VSPIAPQWNKPETPRSPNTTLQICTREASEARSKVAVPC
jgi:hypothetical protein